MTKHFCDCCEKELQIKNGYINSKRVSVDFHNIKRKRFSNRSTLHFCSKECVIRFISDIEIFSRFNSKNERAVSYSFIDEGLFSYPSES